MDRRSVGRAPSPSRSTSPRLASESVVSARARGFSSHLDSLPGAGLGGSRRYSAGAISPREATSGNFPFSFYNTPTPAPASPPNRLGNPYSEPITLASRGQQSPQSYDQAQSPLPRRSSLGGGGKPYERQQRPDSLAHHSQGRVHHQGFQQSQTHHLQRPISPLNLDGDVEEDERRRRGRTPPDMCAVCAETSTPEWRKGPAGARMLCNGCGLMGAKRAKERAQNGFGNPTTIASIIRELQGIGEERFKVATGEYQLPPNTPARIQATQARTVEQESRQKSSRPREKKTRTGGPEREAAESLVGMARRPSVSGQSPPSAPSSSFGQRRGSLNSAQGPTIYSLPRSRRANSFTLAPTRPQTSLVASAMTNPGPPSSYTFGGLSNLSSLGSSIPSYTSTIDTGRSPTRAQSPGRTRSPGVSTSSSLAPLTSSSRMNISFITDPTPASPPVTWGISDLRTRRTPSPAGQRRRSLTEMEMAFEKRRSQQYS